VTKNPGAAELGALRQLGIPADTIRRAVDRGDPQSAIFDAVVLPRIGERTVTATEIEAMGGLSVSATATLIEAFGLPAPAPDARAFTPREAEALVLLARFEQVWPADFRSRSARVSGRHLARIAHTEVQDLRAQLTSRLAGEDIEGVEGLHRLREALAQWQPIAESLLVGVHQRWIERELAQAAVGQAESAGGADQLPGAVDVTIAFCDLKDFTAYADLNGDAAAVESIERFSEIVARERGKRVRLTKLLGDGAMLVYADAREAVRAAVRILDALRDREGPDGHASIHRGVALAREGDYFGGTVNLAARLLTTAGRNELITTSAVAEATADEFAWVRAGVLEFRGIGEPVDTFRLKPMA
jgi:adenylate cyclase